MERLDPRTRTDTYGRRINRAHSPTLAYSVPILSIMLGSMVPILFVASAVPFVPPLGFLILMAWRIVRPGLLPVWAGLPLGAFDDLFSGQPFGSAMLLWSIAMIGMEIIEVRFPWRSFVQDWLTIALATALYLIAMMVVSGGPPGPAMALGLVPQFLLSVLLFPVIARQVARLDRLRLMRFWTVG